MKAHAPIVSAIALAWFALSACNEANFANKENKKRAPAADEHKLRKDDDAKGDPNESEGPGDDDANKADCTGLDKAKCVEAREAKSTKESFRTVDCAAKDEASCKDAIKEEKAKDEDIGSEIRVKNCKDYCPSLKDLGVSVSSSDDPSKDLAAGDGAKIKGQKVVRVGVNFEDLFDKAKSDRDYNDAVLCFKGSFAVDGTNVTSLKDQTVTAETSSISGCSHNITVKIVKSSGGTRKSITYASRERKPIELVFKKGDKLEVTMLTVSGRCTKTPVDMHNPAAAIVKPDVCNKTGK